MIHGARKNGKAHGVVTTKQSIVCKMLDLANYKETFDLRHIRILEPSAGEGAFAVEILKRLYKSSIGYNFDFSNATNNICFIEINNEIGNVLKENIHLFFQSVNVSENNIKIKIEDFLNFDINTKFDLILGNPPYVRHENIPEIDKSRYQSIFRTFTNRADLYIPFYEKGLSLLNENGLLSFVCSNRWLKNQYGKKLRKLVATSYKVDFIIDVEEVAVFTEDVLGYPAITNISKSPPSQTSPYFIIDELKELLSFNLQFEVSSYLTLKNVDWFSYVFSGELYEKNISKIEEQGFKIRIGVATGKDAVFIRKDFKEIIEETLAIPLLKSRDVKGDTINWQGNYILNPYTVTGDLINLKEHPKASRYLVDNKLELSKRHTAKKNPLKWYKTIDKIDVNLLKEPKVILPDISGKRCIHVDDGNFYPHHNLYYITGGSFSKMCLLAAILMSDFVYQQLFANGNKMNGGYPRWQSQNLRKLVVPIIDSIPEEIQEQLLQAYKAKRFEKINKLINTDTISTFNCEKGQLAFFEPNSKY